MNHYELSRTFWDWSFENPEKVKPIHSALYFFAIEHCNRLGWKEKFGLPTTMAKEAIGVRSYNTYINALSDLVDWGFLILIEKSKNQYSSNIIALSKFNKALDKALDKALIKHGTKQSESTHQSIDSIDKQYNNITINKKRLSEVDTSDVPKNHIEYFELAKWCHKKFREVVRTANGSTKTIDNAKYKAWVDPIRLMMETDKITRGQIAEAVCFVVESSFWKGNIQSTSKLRDKFNTLIIQATEQKNNPQKNKPQEQVWTPPKLKYL